MSSNLIVPARLFVILAREVPLGLIFRRGPSEWTHLIQWNTETDTFESGAWFKGRMYPERCDLSPDGTKLAYFALNFASHSNFSPSWTGVSKVPWLTALGLWPQSGTWYGGGLFETNNRVWINSDGYGYPEVEQFHPPELEVSLEHRFFNQDRLFIFRMERDGWQAVEAKPSLLIPIPRIDVDEHSFQPVDSSRVSLPYRSVVHEKPKPQSSFSLCMISDFVQSTREAGQSSRTFEVRNKNKKTLPWKESVPLEGAVWADWDSRGRLVYAKEGKLFAADVHDGAELSPVEIGDFNDLRPCRTKSPAWARSW